MSDNEAVLHITDADFASVVSTSDKPVLVDFWATWCGPCRMIAPVLESIAAEYSQYLTVAKLDVDANPKTASQFNITGIPTLILFKDGQPVKQMVGVKNKAALLQDLAEVLPS